MDFICVWKNIIAFNLNLKLVLKKVKFDDISMASDISDDKSDKTLKCMLYLLQEPIDIFNYDSFDLLAYYNEVMK